MTNDELAAHYPRLFHMAEINTWDSIRRHGLLSTTALLDLYGINGKIRAAIESCHRPECVPITHADYGVAVIRDQKPMSDAALSRCLKGVSPKQWYELLNGRTFFWLSRDRLNRLLNARAYRDRAHCIITVDTKQLLARHAEHVTLSPINSGSTIMNARPRSPATFHSIESFPFANRRKTRRIEDAVVELAVDHSVPDIAEIAVSVEHWKADRLVKRIWAYA